VAVPAGQGSPVRSGWRWARLGGWPADHFDEAEHDQQQDGDHHHDRGGRQETSVVIKGAKEARRQASHVLYERGLSNAPYSDLDMWSRP
jgi:hypothetical protein